MIQVCIIVSSTNFQSIHIFYYVDMPDVTVSYETPLG